MKKNNDTFPDFVGRGINLAQPRFGCEILSCTDDFFAACDRMLKPEEPVFIDGKFDGNGKWMDGWETRRRREPGNDWCILQLGHRGEIEKILLDTAFFKGNYPDHFSIQAADIGAVTDGSLISQSLFWKELLPQQKLQMDKEHYFSDEINKIGPVTHIKLNIYPDGGVSRLRLSGRLV